MPLYEYFCKKCECNFEHFYKSLPSEKKQKEAVCPDCDEIGGRVLSPFLQGNSQNSGIEKAMGNNAMTVDVGGRRVPAYRDANGKLHEVKSEADIRHWQRSNQYGTPRMVNWRNPKTGETSLVPLRVKMIADPVSGEPIDAPVVRESVELVPVDDFQMPSRTKNDIPLDPKTGTVDWSKIGQCRVPGTQGLVDPDTHKPMTMGGVWGDKMGGDSNRNAAKELLKGRQMSQQDVVRILASE